jgi:4-hydroxy-tetrahydrodipicolinate reductase
MPTRIVVAGARGRVGQVMLSELGREPDCAVVGGFGRHDADAELDRLLPHADVLVDFTTAEAAPPLLLRAARAGVRPISGTTGLSADTLAELDAELRRRQLAGVWASNFAIGAALMLHFARIAARYMDAVEIVELHHDRKVDAPSGTAVSTARAIRQAREQDLPDPPVQRWTLEGARGAVEGGVRIHSIRLPGLVAHQEVIFGSTGQILTLRHDATGRDLYVPGVLLAVRAVMAAPSPGLIRGLDTLMGLDEAMRG